MATKASRLIFAGFDDVQNGAEQLLGFFGLGPTGIVPVVLHQDLVAGEQDAGAFDGGLECRYCLLALFDRQAVFAGIVQQLPLSFGGGDVR